MARVAYVVAGILGKTDLHDGRGTVFRNVHAIRIVGIQQDHAFARHDIEQPAKARLDLLEVAIDIRMIELDVVHDDEFGKVVDKFRPLVEKGGVVFVTLNNEMFRVSEARALAEVFGDASDQIAGLKPGALKDPGQKRRGGGFAVGAGDDQIVPSAQEELLEGLGKRKIVQLAVEHGFHRGISARHGVADDDEVRRGYVVRAEALGNR